LAAIAGGSYFPKMTLNEEIAALSELVSSARWQRIQTVLAQRTRWLTVVLEDIYQPHNASAVLRSCDAFGIQDVHIIEVENKYRINPDVALGSSQWLSLKRYPMGEYGRHTCLDELKKAGYQLAAATLRPQSIALSDFKPEQATAILFGNEENGLSEQVHEQADVYLQIPMHGFTQSLNLSVSAAIILHTLRGKIPPGAGRFRMTETEREKIALTWLVNSLRAGEKHLQRLREGSNK
jgi:tRNA (guanosine-2'-O-)-methyltransferase